MGLGKNINLPRNHFSFSCDPAVTLCRMTKQPEFAECTLPAISRADNLCRRMDRSVKMVKILILFLGPALTYITQLSFTISAHFKLYRCCILDANWGEADGPFTTQVS